jgi:hypothetical protein
MTWIGVYPLHHEAVQIARKQAETREHDTVLVDLIIAERLDARLRPISEADTTEPRYPPLRVGPLCSVLSAFLM